METARGLYGDLINQVFQNELLTEHIIQFVIRNGTEVCYSAVKTCRLVNSTWLQLVSTSLRKSREPLFQLKLAGIDDKFKLNKFENVMANKVQRKQRVDPTAVHINNKCLDSEFDFKPLFRLSRSLVSLYLEIPERGFCEQGLINATAFPILNKLNIKIEVSPCENAVNVPVLEMILSGSQNLKCFILSGEPIVNFLPLNMENWHIPRTTRRLQVDRAVRTEHLKVLMTSQFPQLTSFTLSFGILPFEDNLIHTILSKVSNTLKYLSLKGCSPCECDCSSNIQPTAVQLPYMKHLENLEVMASNIHWVHGSTAQMSAVLPALTKLVFAGKILTDVCEWAGPSCFKAVKSLVIITTVPVVPIEFRNEMSKLVRPMFPNVIEIDFVSRTASVNSVGTRTLKFNCYNFRVG